MNRYAVAICCTSSLFLAGCGPTLKNSADRVTKPRPKPSVRCKGMPAHECREAAEMTCPDSRVVTVSLSQSERILVTCERSRDIPPPAPSVEEQEAVTRAARAHTISRQEAAQIVHSIARQEAAQIARRSYFRTHPEHRSARVTRLAGILTGSIGTPLFTVAALMAFSADRECQGFIDLWCGFDGGNELGVVSLLLAGTSLAVGIFLGITGHNAVKRIERIERVGRSPPTPAPITRWGSGGVLWTF